MHGAELLKDIGLSIIAAAAVGIPAYLVRAPLLLAYLAAGVLLGQNLGLGLIKGAENITTLSEIGLVLLMFILGLEINLKKLLEAGKAVAVNGITQFLGCALLAVGFFYAFGFKIGDGQYEIVYLSVACALSSTLIVVKVLSDRMELDTLTSRITLGILVLQDLWAIIFLALQPNLAHLKPDILIMSVGRGALLVGLSLFIAKFILPNVFSKVAKNPELMLVTAIAWCCTICGIANVLHLSLEMGGLVAGVSIASFPYHTEIAAKISSLRDFFITLFFVALGLQIPQPTSEILTLTGLIVVFVLFSRVITMFPVLYFFKYGNRGSFVPALNLSQVSEFSLVLVSLGVTYGHISSDVLSAFVLALVVTALVSSLAIPRSHSIYRAINPLLEKLGFKDEVLHVLPDNVHPLKPKQDQVVLLGFYREASSFLQEMINRHSRSALDQILVVDFNPEAHQELKSMGVHCKYGDISHPDTLQQLNLEHAEVFICTIPDHQLKGTNNLNLLRFLKGLAPQSKIIVTADSLDSAQQMYDEGAAYVYIPRLLAARHLADVLEKIDTGVGHLQAEIELTAKHWKEVVR